MAQIGPIGRTKLLVAKGVWPGVCIPILHRYLPARHHRAVPASPAQAISAGKVRVEPRGNTRDSAATNRRRAGCRESAAINRRRAEPPRIRCHQEGGGRESRIFARMEAPSFGPWQKNYYDEKIGRETRGRQRPIFKGARAGGGDSSQGQEPRARAK